MPPPREISPAGRYVVMTEKSIDLSGGSANDNEVGPKTDVIDTITGGGVTYQDIKVTGNNGDPQASRDAAGDAGHLADHPAARRDPDQPGQAARLPAEPGEDAAVGQGEPAARRSKGRQEDRAVSPKGPQPTDNDLVFEQAADLLWQPHLSPALRSALYKVLADTPGVVVTHPHRTT